MHDVVPRDPSLTTTQNRPVTGENSSINQDCSDRSVLKKHGQWWMFRHFVLLDQSNSNSYQGFSAVVHFVWHYAALLTSFSGYRKRLTRIRGGVWAKQKRGNILHKLTWDKRYLRPPREVGVFFLTKTQMLCPLQVSYLPLNCHQQTLRPFFQDLVSPLV